MVVASRRRSKGFRRALFGVCLLALGTLPATIAHQDLGALLASQPEVSQRWRAHVLASPFGSMSVASFNFPRPLGTNIPELDVRRVSPSADYDDQSGPGKALTLTYIHPMELPQINRSGKGDRLALAPDPVANASDIVVHSVPSETFLRPAGELALPVGPAAPAGRMMLASVDPAALLSESGPSEAEEDQSVARKGEVTGAEQRPKTPAERLKLTGRELARAKKCLAEAVYFEARSEPRQGQLAVAQVVMNRVFSPFYPSKVCDVVFQNAHRRLACQFTFACDGTRRVFNEADLWKQAQQIAQDTLDGKVWVPTVGKSTHYHANYVRPYWVRSMRRHTRIGAHIFYRPRRWGDGAEEPRWGAGVTGAIVHTVSADAS